jgi:hypothetical protein
MNISSNSLFHFTSKFETLKKILENDFYIQFCGETFLNVVTGFSEDYLEKGVPMVCFCDLPLSQVNNHTAIYGGYAIGLSKAWGIKNKVNPIIYTYYNSDLTAKLFEFYKTLRSEQNKPKGLHYHLDGIMQYVKPYSGVFKKGRKIYKNYKFYDEREWRYIPKLYDEIQPVWIKRKENTELNVAVINRDILEGKIEKTKLSFEAADIKYIIVKKESERKKIISSLNKIKTKRYSVAEMQLLMTRIMSLEQIIADY